MSRRIRSLIWGAVAVVVLVGAVLAVRLLPPAEPIADTPTEPTLPALVDQSATDGTPTAISVTLTLAEETFTVEADAQGVFAVTAYADLPVNAEAVSALRRALTVVRPTSLVKENASEEELAAFGFSKPQAVAAVTYANGTAEKLELGAADFGGKGGAYLRRAGSATVYLADTELVSTLTAPSLSYIGTTLFDAPQARTDDTEGKAQLMELILAGSSRSEPITLRYQTAEDLQQLALSSPYTLVSPYYRTTDSQKTKSWQTGLNILRAGKTIAVHPTEEKLEEYGLADPFSTACLTLAVYREREGTEPEVYHTVQYRVKLGKKDADGNYYAMQEGVDVVYTVTEASVPWATLTYPDLISDYLFLRYITDLRGLSIEKDGVETTVRFAHSKSEQGADLLEATVGGKAYDATKTRSVYQSLMLIHRLDEAEGQVPTGAPLCTVRLLPFEDTQESTAIRFYAYSVNRYLCCQPDGDTYFVKASEVDSAMREWDDYLAHAGTA